MQKYVIVGGSAGAIGAVEAIRELDRVGTITVVSEEPFLQYSRPLLADFLSGEATLEDMKYRDDHFWERNEIQLLAGRPAVSLDAAEKYVELEGGDRINFEKLLIATGGKSFVPGIEGSDIEGVFTFTAFSDVARLAARIGEGKKAVVIGGGLIGVSVAEALMKRGLKVTIVELKERLLSIILDEVASEIIEKAIRKTGVKIITGQTVKLILGEPKDNKGIVIGVVLTNDEEIPCDFVVIAIGVVPRTDLVARTEVKVNRGILVDRFMRTSVPDIYACGDVAEAYDFISGKNGLVLLWPVAHLGGRVAGYNMAGKKMEYPGGTAMSALKCFDTPIISIGTANPKENDDYEVLVNYDPARNLYKKIVLKDDDIVGAIFVSDIDKAGIIFYLMQNRVDVKEFKKSLISEDFGLATLPALLRRRMFMEGLGWRY